LQTEGYDIEVRAGHLVVNHVPYLNERGEVCLGTLACVLDNDGNVATLPSDHTMLFAGEFPYSAQGERLDIIHADSNPVQIHDKLTTQHRFSTKPLETNGKYPSFYEKVCVYANQLSGHAEAVDPNVSSRPFNPISVTEEESPFRYLDTASARAGISVVTKKLELSKVAIVGVGGSGAYVLDLVAKTPVGEVHLFDGDTFHSHNAFRGPGAASLEDLQAHPSKVEYWKGKYDAFRYGIVGHDRYLTEENLADLADMDFVFLCLDGNRAKRVIVAWLEERNIRFIDVGMGLYQADGMIAGILRMMVSTPEHPAIGRIPFSDDNINDVYATNIQVADLNALNATFAVIKWKKLYGFYADLLEETQCFYAIDGNQLTNEQL
jgi:hypothetical protein